MTTTTSTYSPVQPTTFALTVEYAMQADGKIATYLSHGVDYSTHHTYVAPDGLSGYAISADGDLQSVFSLEKGRGSALIESANRCGAKTLDCFDGYLPAFYAAHGWHETHREANWTPGGPDVVYMAR